MPLRSSYNISNKVHIYMINMPSFRIQSSALTRFFTSFGNIFNYLWSDLSQNSCHCGTSARKSPFPSALHNILFFSLAFIFILHREWCRSRSQIRKITMPYRALTRSLCLSLSSLPVCDDAHCLDQYINALLHQTTHQLCFVSHK